jgi:oligopeptide/dipeptide ABC transporter ATP-binding protein
VKRSFDTAILLITHNLGIIAEACERVAVMYAGRIAETGPAAATFADPRHGYTASLLRSLPDVDAPSEPRAIPGEPPDPRRPPSGCRFHPRCPYRMDGCDELPFQLADIGGGRRSACIHGRTGLPDPVPAAGVPVTDSAGDGAASATDPATEPSAGYLDPADPARRSGPAGPVDPLAQGVAR